MDRSGIARGIAFRFLIHNLVESEVKARKIVSLEMAEQQQF